MSIIVGVRKAGKIAVAADTMHFYGSRREHGDNLANRSKVRKVGTSYIGGVGWSVYDNILSHYFKSMRRPPSLRDEMAIFDCFLKMWHKLKEKYQVVNDQPSDSDDRGPFADIDATFLVANRHGLFEIDSDLSVMRFDKYAAIGSGNKYAFGALYNLYDSRRTAAQIAKLAVATAIHFDTHCGGNTEVFEIK